MTNEELFEKLTEEQKEKFKACKSEEELQKLLEEEGIELDPEQLEAVLLPEAGIAFVAGRRETAPPDERGELRARTLALALAELREAKRLHDELEVISGRYMDFAALTEFTESTIARLFN